MAVLSNICSLQFLLFCVSPISLVSLPWPMFLSDLQFFYNCYIFLFYASIMIFTIIFFILRYDVCYTFMIIYENGIVICIWRDRRKISVTCILLVKNFHEENCILWWFFQIAAFNQNLRYFQIISLKRLFYLDHKFFDEFSRGQKRKLTQ